MWGYEKYRMTVDLPKLAELSRAPVMNPYSKRSWNLTLQFELQRNDPATAERLRQLAAGE